MVSLPTSSDEDLEIDYEENPFEEDHKGFPESCFCGGEAILEKKRTGPDAGRLYYRCGNVGELDTTAHLGKWFDTAVEEECQKMRQDIERIGCQSRVDCDYVTRLCALEGSHERMQTTVSWLAEEVEGWMDNFKLNAIESAEKRMARKMLWDRFNRVLNFRPTKTVVAIILALLASFLTGWCLREFL